METWSLVDNRYILHCACRFLAVIWASDAQELCAIPGPGGGGRQCRRLRLLSTDLSPESLPCANGDLRLEVLSVCGYRVAWGPWDILTLVSSWAWALVCYLTGNWVCLGSTKSPVSRLCRQDL